MTMSQEREFKINKVIWTTKSKVIYVRVSIPWQYQMMMSSVARVKLIKTKVIFMYHTKGLKPSSIIFGSRNYGSRITKMKKNEKVGKDFLDYKTGQ